ncbi:uncharacterized protein LOC135222132 [Macrobrachium nipponense]|uniref:uncharacterized protein LOC135222132 n=1 Tax=Macrobrachium nipponense TaxID=159736 RepID=UPI0030C7ADEF
MPKKYSRRTDIAKALDPNDQNTERTHMQIPSKPPNRPHKRPLPLFVRRHRVHNKAGRTNKKGSCNLPGGKGQPAEARTPRPPERCSSNTTSPTTHIIPSTPTTTNPPTQQQHPTNKSHPQRPTEYNPPPLQQQQPQQHRHQEPRYRQQKPPTNQRRNPPTQKPQQDQQRNTFHRDPPDRHKTKTQTTHHTCLKNHVLLHINSETKHPYFPTPPNHMHTPPTPTPPVTVVPVPKVSTTP